ncbi:hypothetical protein BV898_13593 [Hypsibius exemplaris]|uniref:C3H1-type domain-containing protein n=1 Tax=Hypsibius exemplaris TaxID=2072580 RepID=A0A1W0WA68_HYPEX|nr:hypothetical protein BV898_13593 [Hypsibius exemplaris]
MPLLQRLSKRVGCRIWDAIKAKLKELTGREKIDKALVDYVFVLFDPSNSQQALRSKLLDFLGDKTDPFVEWFAKVVSQVDNQVSKVQGGDKESSSSSIKADEQKEEHNPVETEEGEKATDVYLDGILLQSRKDRSVDGDRTSKSDGDHKAESGEASFSRRHRSNHDQSDRSHDRHKDHGERKGASRMLSKATQDAVKSVQSVSGGTVATSSATHGTFGSRDKHRTASPSERREYALEITVDGDERSPGSPQSDANHGREENADEPVTPVSPEANELEIVDVAPEEPPAQPITVVTRSHGNMHKRTYDEAMDVESFQPSINQNPVVITAAQNNSGPTNRFVYQSAQGPLVVPEKETEENEPMDDDNNIPGLLVVMPATTHDPLSRIKLGSDDRMFGGAGSPGRGGRHYGHYGPQPGMPFNRNPSFNRAPFAHLPPYQSGYWEGPMEKEDFGGGGPHPNPAKRMRTAPATPIDPSLIMCRFLPKCAKTAEVCPFYHPACRNGKYCRFGDSCVYDHSGAATANGNAKQLVTKKPICRFYPNCTQPQCPFLHKQAIPCSFGTYCRMGPQKCTFLHPEDVQVESLSSSETLHIADYDDDSEACDTDGDHTQVANTPAGADLDQDGGSNDASYDDVQPVVT